VDPDHATLGLFLSLIVIIAVKAILGDAAFDDWGWRIPFLMSIFLLAISVWIRLSLNESPAFKRMKEEGKTSKAPLAESFGEWKNAKIVLLALLGLTAGQGVVWYTGQFYALFFLTAQLKVDATDGAADDRRVAAPRHAVLHRLRRAVGQDRPQAHHHGGLPDRRADLLPAVRRAHQGREPGAGGGAGEEQGPRPRRPGDLLVPGQPDRARDRLQDPCDIAKRFLAQSSVSYDNVDAPAGTPTTVTVGDKKITPPAATVVNQKFDKESTDKIAAFKKEITADLGAAGYPAKAKPIEFMSGQWWSVVAILWLLVIYVTMVYGPIAAALVELFPTRIRYTSMSLPYHIGNGWFGGLLPTTAFAIVASTGNMYNGLWYPIIVATMTFIIGTLFVRETKDVDIYAGDR
jgi:hypothetical protein